METIINWFFLTPGRRCEVERLIPILSFLFLWRREALVAVAVGWAGRTVKALGHSISILGRLAGPLRSTTRFSSEAPTDPPSRIDA